VLPNAELNEDPAAGALLLCIEPRQRRRSGIHLMIFIFFGLWFWIISSAQLVEASVGWRWLPTWLSDAGDSMDNFIRESPFLGVAIVLLLLFVFLLAVLWTVDNVLASPPVRVEIRGEGISFGWGRSARWLPWNQLLGYRDSSEKFVCVASPGRLFSRRWWRIPTATESERAGLLKILDEKRLERLG
jgi:hypothetical protein